MPCSAAIATTSSIGCSVPTSLLAHITETRATDAGVALDRGAQRGEVEPAGAVDRQQLDLGALVLGEPVQRVEHGVVLDRGGEDPRAARVGGAARPEEALEREVVGLGAAGGEHDLAGTAAERPRRSSRATPRRPGGRCRPEACSEDGLPTRRAGRSSPRPPPAASAWSRRGRGRRSWPAKRTARPQGGGPPPHRYAALGHRSAIHRVHGCSSP